MTAEQFQIFCITCDSALLAPDSSVERVAIAWLHVVNEHPVSLAKYRRLLEGRSPDRLIALKSIAGTAKRATKTLRSNAGWHVSSVLPDAVDILFVSHILNEHQLGAEKDFYFGSLPESAIAAGLSCVVVLIDHTGLNLQDIANRWPVNSAPRVVFDSTLPWRDELSIRSRLKRESRKLRKLSDNAETHRERLALLHASSEAMSSTSTATLRFYEQLVRLAHHLKPKAITVTYEGHAWERLAFLAARLAVPDVRCVGYQHTVLFPLQHAIKRNLGTGFDPDVILTAGEVAQNILRGVKSLELVQIEAVGTHRFEVPRLSILEKISNHNKHSCLVIPDGIPSECVLILNFVIDAALLVPALKFIIRMHPVLDFDAMAANHPRFRVLPENIEISKSPIGDDFARCRWALYRGSSAAIHSVIAGLRPFYISCANELAIDPLYQLSTWRIIIKSPSEFAIKVQRDLNASSSKIIDEFTGAYEYCQKYFEKLNINNFYKAVSG